MARVTLGLILAAVGGGILVHGVYIPDDPGTGVSVIGFILFIIVVGLSLTIVRSKLKYESWYLVHILVYVAVFLSFWRGRAGGISTS